MADIFLSYAREDSAWASRLAATLEEHGWSVFWDQRIPTGKSFDQIIEQELEAARCVIVLWSKHSISSDFVKGEASEGLSRAILHPVWIDQVKIPLEFRRLQTAHLVDWQPGAEHAGFDHFLADVTNTLRSTPPLREPRAWRAEREARRGGVDVKGLLTLRAEGVTLRNREVRDEMKALLFQKDFVAWEKSVMAEMRKAGVPVSDVAWFETLDLVPEMGWPASSDLHSRDLNQLTEKLRRLLEIAQRNDSSRSSR